jgi:hypothetical protein
LVPRFHPPLCFESSTSAPPPPPQLFLSDAFIKNPLVASVKSSEEADPESGP